MNKCREEGLVATSILDNPYWKKYPKDEGSFEESKARHFVDGYISKGDINAETNA